MEIFNINKEKVREKAGSSPLQDAELSGKVSRMIGEIRENGVQACLQYTLEFDKIGMRKQDLVTLPAKTPVPAGIPSDFKKAFKKAIANIHAFHKKQKPNDYQISLGKGAYAGERWIPLERVGCYVPGGSAPLISTVMMTVIPAKIAGVRSITVCTPPDKSGKTNPYILYACKELKVDQILNLGGVQGIAALALGIGIEKVQKIVGPGNRYVTEAKRQLYGEIDIDMLAGPSEVCILADDSADGTFIAADLLSQIEHDPFSEGVLVTTSGKLIDKVILALKEQKQMLSRKEILERSIHNIRLIRVKNLEEAVNAVDQIAPEHLEVMTREKKLEKYPFKAGAVFLGNFTSVPVGDFYGGTNHVLPTGRRAAFSSPLSVYDFYRRSQYLKYDEAMIRSNGKYISLLAGCEGLPAHKNTIDLRMK